MVDMGVMYANGIGVQADVSKAAMWYNRAADLGNSAGMVNIGWLHEYGKGVELDVSKAASTGWRPQFPLDEGLRLALSAPQG